MLCNLSCYSIPRVSPSKNSSPAKDMARGPPAGMKTAWGDDREPVSSRNEAESIHSGYRYITVEMQFNEKHIITVEIIK